MNIAFQSTGIPPACIVCCGPATEWCAELAHRALASTITPEMKPHCREHGVMRFVSLSPEVVAAVRAYGVALRRVGRSGAISRDLDAALVALETALLAER